MRRSAPAHAIIAALSVHSAGGGTTKRHLVLQGDVEQRIADRLVRSDAAGGDQRGRRAELLAEHPQAIAQPVGHHLDNCQLERRGEVGDIAVGQRRDLLRLEAHRSLEAGQREIGILPAAHRARQKEATTVAAGGLALDLRPTRIAEADKLRGLVEGLTDGIVPRRPEPHIIADAAHRDDLGVPPGGEEQAIGKRRAVGEPRRKRMRLEVIDGEERRLAHERNRLRRGEADDDAADQPGAGRRRDAVDVGKAARGLAHRGRDDDVEHLDMGARRDLRNHAAERRMLLDLRQHHVGQDGSAPVRGALDDRRRGFIAGRLDAEHDQLGLARVPRFAFWVMSWCLLPRVTDRE